MDPLSIVAGALAVVHASEKLVRMCHKARLLLAIPEEIDAVTAEVSSLSLLLHTAQERAWILPTEDRQAISTQLRNCEKIVADIDSLISPSLDNPGFAKSSYYRLRWIQRRGRIEVLRQRLEKAERTLYLQFLVSNWNYQHPQSRIFEIDVEERQCRDRIMIKTTNPEHSQTTFVGQSMLPPLPRISKVDDSLPVREITPTTYCHNEMQPELDSSNCQCQCHSFPIQSCQVFELLSGHLTIRYSHDSTFPGLCQTLCGSRYPSRISATWYPPLWLSTTFVKLSIIYGLRLSVTFDFPKIVSPDSDLFRSIRKGDLGRIRTLLQTKQASVADIAAPYGLTPLHLAAVYCQKEVCDLLLQEGAEFYAPSHTWSAKDMFTFFLNHSLCESTMSAAEVIHDLVRMCSTAVCMAALYQCILKLDSVFGSLPRLHKSVLGLTSEPVGLIAPLLGHAINEVDGTSYTALHWATFLGRIDTMETLLHCGADPNMGNRDGITALHVAASTGLCDTIRILMVRGADLEGRDRMGITPLGYAAISGHTGAVSLLLDAGADSQHRNLFGETALSYAIYAQHGVTVDVLQARGVGCDNVDRWGFTPLLDAAYTNSHAVLGNLAGPALQNGARLLNGKSILHIVAENSDLATIEILRRASLRGVDAYWVDGAGFTAMECLRKRKDGERLLEPFGALIVSIVPDGLGDVEENDLLAEDGDFVDALEFQSLYNLVDCSF